MSELKQWSRSELESACEALATAVDPGRSGLRSWATLMRIVIGDKIERLRIEQGNLDVFVPSGQQRYAQIQGEIRGLERFMKPDLGLGEVFRRELKDNA